MRKYGILKCRSRIPSERSVWTAGLSPARRRWCEPRPGRLSRMEDTRPAVSAAGHAHMAPDRGLEALALDDEIMPFRLARNRRDDRLVDELVAR